MKYATIIIKLRLKIRWSIMNYNKIFSKENFIKLIKKNYNTIIITFIIIFSFILNFYAIKNYGYGNEYYSAAVLSMTKSLKNFFFVSFDPSGILSVDKPPLGLWLQCLFVIIFGNNTYSIMLPQALCGSLSSLLIYIIVKKYYKNSLAAILSSLFFSLTPIVVAVSRNNTIDMQLIFVLLLSAMFLLKYIDTTKTKFLLLAGFLVGIGFNIKMLQAYLIIPAFAITYLLFSKTNTKQKIFQCIITTFIIIIVSFSWATIADITPSSQRPYIDNTSSNSVFELIAGNNGMFRVLGDETLDNTIISSNSQDKGKHSFNSIYQFDDYIGNPSIFRFFTESIYGQISWLIIFALSFIIMYIKKIKINKNTQNAFFTLWSTWFISMFLFFSFAGFFHRYYLVMIAPSICILAACSIPIMIEYLKSNVKYKKYILLLCFLITMILEIINIKKFNNIPKLLQILVIFLLLITFIYIINIIKSKKFKEHILLIGIMTILIAPAYWCLTTIIYVPNLTKPSAGPEIANEDLNLQKINGGVTTLKKNLDLEKYLKNNYKEGSFFAATTKSSDLANFIIDTSLPVLSCNGFSGDIDYISLDKFISYVNEGKVRYFIIYNDKEAKDTEITNYVKENAQLIDESEYNMLSQFQSKIALQKKYNLSLYYFNN